MPDIIFFVSSMIALLLSTHVKAQSGRVTESLVTDASVLDPEFLHDARPIDQAAAPAYTATNFFIEVVLRPRELSELNQNVNLSDTAAFVHSLGSDWPVWLKHYNGYLVCLVLAGVYVLTMIIAGFTVCCCRICGKCGAKQGPMDRKGTKHKRRACAFLLGVVSVFMLLGVVMMFMTNVLIYEQTEEAGVPSVLSESIVRFDNFKDTAQENYEFYFKNTFDAELNDIIYSVDNIPASSQNEAARLAGSQVPVDSIPEYINGLDAAVTDLRDVDIAVANIHTPVTTLNSVISELKTNVSRDFAACRVSSPDCATSSNLASSLEPVSAFTGLPSMAAIATAIESHLTGPNNVHDGLSQMRIELDKISGIITYVSGSNISDLTSELRVIVAESEDFLQASFDLMDSVTLAEASTYVNGTVNPALKEYGRYRYYGGLALGTFVLLVTVICCFGLLFGACGERAGGRNHCCNKEMSSKMLKFAVGLVFVFSWILMLVTAVFVPFGGILHNDICRNLQNSARSESANVIDDMIVDYLNLSFSVHDLYTSCREGTTIYDALQMEQRGPAFNLSSLLDPSSYAVDRLIAEITGAAYDPGNIVLLNSVLESKLSQLDSLVQSVDLSMHRILIDQSFNKALLDNLTTALTEAAKKSTSLAVLFQFYADRTASIIQTELSQVQHFVSLLSSAVDRVVTFTSAYNVTNLAHQLELSQVLLTPTAISNATRSVSNDILNTYLQLLSGTDSTIRNELAQCETISNAVTDSLDSVCVSFLYPFNAFWFSMGWCLFFFIWLIPISLVLSGYYRKTEPYTTMLPSLEDPSRPMRPVDDRDTPEVHQRERTEHEFLTTAEITPYSYLPSISGSLEDDHDGLDTRHREERNFRGLFQPPLPWEQDGYRPPSPDYGARSKPVERHRDWDNEAYSDDYAEPLDTWDGPSDSFYPDDIAPPTTSSREPLSRNYQGFYY